MHYQWQGGVVLVDGPVDGGIRIQKIIVTKIERVDGLPPK